MNIALWVLQGLLALVFLASGGMKTVRPISELAKSLEWTGQVSPALVRFIGIAEVLGAIGLILPELTKIVPVLTIAAAAGLAIVMVLAAIFHLQHKDGKMAPSIVLLILSLFVIVGRLVLVPIA